MKGMDAELMAWLHEMNDPFPYSAALSKISSFPA